MNQPVWFAAFADKEKEIEPVMAEWVAQNFSEQFIKSVIAQSFRRDAFVDVPVGLVNPNIDDPTVKKEDGAPESKCQQGEQDLCLSHSLASVLNVCIPNPNPICHKLIHTQKDRKKANMQSWDHFVNKIKNMVDGHCLMNLNSNNFDPLVDVDRFPKLCVLMGSDGSVNHAVTFLYEWMFDSNVKWAQRTTKEILNWSCMSECKCIHKGVSIVPQKLAEGSVLPQCWSVPDSVEW